MPMQPKPQRLIQYRGRTNGLACDHILAVVRRLATWPGLTPEPSTSLTIDLEEIQFNGALSGLDEAEPAISGRAWNSFNVNLIGRLDDQAIHIVLQVIHPTRHVVFAITPGTTQCWDDMLAEVLAVFPREDDQSSDLVLLREALGKANELVHLAAAAQKAGERARAHAATVEGAASSAGATLAKLQDAGREADVGAAEVAAAGSKAGVLLAEAQVARQAIAEHEVKITAVANTTADLERRITEAESRARGMIAETYDRIDASLKEFEVKSTKSLLDGIAMTQSMADHLVQKATGMGERL